MKEIDKSTVKLPDGYYLVKDGILYSLNVKAFPGTTIKIPEDKIAPDDELQHVEYTAAQCGYEK